MFLARLRSFVLCSAVLLGLVAGTALAADADTALQDAVTKANSEWAEAMKTGDAAVIAAPYTDDAVLVLADGKAVHGRAEIEAMYRDGFAKAGPMATSRIESRHLERDGDLAYESGYGEVGVVREGKAVTNGGRYLTVWQRQADGGWKIARNLVLP